MQEQMMTQNIIITEKCSTLRQLGRNALRGKWPGSIIAICIYLVCLGFPVMLFNHLFGVNMANVVTNDGYTYSMDAELYQQIYNSLPRTSSLSSIWIILITGALQLGLALYFLASFRGHNVSPKDIFLGFEKFGKALGLFVYQAVFIFLWGMLFIIPGVIAAIRYSQAFYVLADDPTKSIRECVNESKIMMRGNKAKYFVLTISFIGWMLLASIPGGILEGIVNTVGGGDAAEIIVRGVRDFDVPTHRANSCARLEATSLRGRLRPAAMSSKPCDTSMSSSSLVIIAAFGIRRAGNCTANGKPR